MALFEEKPMPKAIQVFDKILVLDGTIYSQAATQEELGERLDELVKMVLDEGLHDDEGVAYKMIGFECLLN